MGSGEAKGSERDLGCAFERMKVARFQFTERYNRDPLDVEELDAFYRQLWDADEADEGRLRRARWVLEHSTFDITASADGGYVASRDQLLKAVRDHVRPGHREGLSYPFALTDEDLAVGLWVVTKGSFEVKEDVRRQWTCPGNSFTDMFKVLKEEGVVDRGCTRTDKVASIKAVLERAGLALCIDDGYRFCPDRKDLGVGKKYVVGPNHWRWDEFLEFAKDVSVVWINALAVPQLPDLHLLVQLRDAEVEVPVVHGGRSAHVAHGDAGEPRFPPQCAPTSRCAVGAKYTTTPRGAAKSPRGWRVTGRQRGRG